MKAWFVANGGVLHPEVELLHLAGMGYALGVASEDAGVKDAGVKADDVLLSVPFNLTINTAQVLRKPPFGDALRVALQDTSVKKLFAEQEAKVS